MPFQAIKTRSSKTRKIEIFLKEVSPWFWSKIGYFCIFLFQLIQSRKMSFTIFQNEKTPFQPIKRRSSKSRKIEIFPKGLIHGFGPKMAIFSTFFFFRQYIPRKCLLRYSRSKKRLSRLQKQEVQKVEKIDIFEKDLKQLRGQCMVLVQNWSFLHVFILGILGEQNVFHDTVRRRKKCLSRL